MFSVDMVCVKSLCVVSAITDDYSTQNVGKNKAEKSPMRVEMRLRMGKDGVFLACLFVYKVLYSNFRTFDSPPYRATYGACS